MMLRSTPDFPVVPVVSAVVATAVMASYAVAQSGALDVPYVRTSSETVAKMLDLADVGPNDIVYDLGSGDGRIVIAAVRELGAKKGVGVDIDPQRVREATKNAAAAGVSDRTTFVQGDIFDFDFSEATVVTMYLLTRVNRRLRPRILDELRPGTRVVSHQFSMGEWKADEKAETGSTVYFWVVPAKVEGTWEWETDGRTYRLNLDQKYQEVSGTLQTAERQIPIANATLSGRNLRFEVTDGEVGRIEARLTDDAVMEGTITSGERKRSFTARSID